MSEYVITELEQTRNVTIRTCVEVIDGDGNGRLEGITIRDRQSGLCERLETSGLFVLIGADPHTEWLNGAVERDPKGYILTGTDLMRDGNLQSSWPLKRPPFHLETSLPGVFAAGDVRCGSVKRVAAAVGEGATAVQQLQLYLAELQVQGRKKGLAMS
jgi:thioredoxin reductase (NADPH)